MTYKFIPCKLKLFFILQFCFSLNSFAQFNVDVILDQAKKDINVENYSEAISKLNRCIQAEPANYEACYLRALCKYTLKDNIGAEQDFTAAVAAFSPFYYDAYLFRSRVHYRLGNYPGAVDDINKVIAKQGNNPKLYIERAFDRLAASDFNGAISDCQKAATWPLISDDLYLCKGAAEDALADYEQALCDYDLALTINPKNEEIYIRRGMSEFKLERIHEAMDDYNAALKIDSIATFAYFNRAEAFSKMNDDASAMKDYNTILTLEPRNAYAYFNRGILYSKKQSFKKALADFDNVLALNPDNIQALFNRAKIKQQLKNYNDAISDYDKIILLYPYFMEAYYNKAEVKYLMNDTIGANEAFNLGKIMSEVFHAKSGAQLDRDSIKLVKLMHLNADFNSGLTIQNDTTDLSFRPIFYLTGKDSLVQNFIFNSLVEKYNSKSMHPVCFSNSEVQGAFVLNDIHASSNFTKNNDEQYQLFKVIQKSNMQLLQSAGDELDKIIEMDSLNALAFFTRGINTTREIELMSDDAASAGIFNSNQTISENKKNKICQAALSDFSKAIQLDPSFEFAYYNRAYIKCMLHDYNGALRDYENVIKLKPALADTYYNRGIVLFYLNDKQNACHDFSKAGELGLSAAYAFIQKYCHEISR